MASYMTMMDTIRAMANRVECVPQYRPVATTMAQTVAEWALGIPPAPHMRSGMNFPTRMRLMMTLIIWAESELIRAVTST